jgi:hypothetical protein
VTRAAAALAAGAALLVGCGGDDGDTPRAAWEGQPVVAVHPELPGDRLLTARVRNESGSDLVLDAARARLTDAGGRRLRATVRFAAGYSHSLYPPRDAPSETPRQESERLGAVATIPPDGTAPVTVAWHARAGSAPRLLDLGPVTLSVPAPPSPR